MFTDGRQLSADTTLESDVCIIGGGIVGVALANEFVDSPLRVLLLEGGGLHEEPNAGAVYGVVGARPATLAVDKSKASFFGGNTNYWFGNCRPLDEADFEYREWIPYSGWPFGRQELLPHYERAQSFLGLADFSLYDLGAFREQLEQPLLSVDESVLEYKVVQQCPELRFGKLYRSRLEASRNVQVLLYTRAVRLETNPGGDCVSAVEVVLPDGTRLRVRARLFILATGGVENARLLLYSNQASPRGLGNDHDLVGRFFMEHWVYDIGLGGWGDGLGPLDYDRHEDAGGVNTWVQLVLAEELMRTERVPGLMLYAHETDRRTPSGDGIRNLAKALVRRGPAQLTDVRLLLSDPGEAFRYAGRRLAGRMAPSEGHTMHFQVEQTPDPQNRIRLSKRVDRFGHPTAELTLRLTDEERRRNVKLLLTAAEALGLTGARLAKQARLLLNGRSEFYWHHMGTTRISDDPAQGVVDANCRVHGVSNLFVAGSSVFPTGGAAAPTLTIVALALRLADHLRELDRARA